MKKIKSSIQSIPGYLEKIRRDPSNTELGKISYFSLVIINISTKGIV